MEVNLKKAAALALGLSGQQVAVPHSFAVDIYGQSPSEADIVKLQSEFVASLERGRSVLGAVYLLRHLIGQANEGRVNLLLTARSELDKQLAFLGKIPLRAVGSNLAAVAAKMEAAKNPDASQLRRVYGGGDGVTLELETASTLLPAISELKKKRLKVEDELAALNFTKTIKIPDDVALLLAELDLI